MTSKISRTDEFSKRHEGVFSNFGRYYLTDEINLNLPGNTVTLKDLNNGTFSYLRNSQNEIIKRLVQVKTETPQIELAPVLPIHVPSYKTDFFFLRFEEPVSIAENSTLETLIQFPIEIGLFLVEQNESKGLDFFSCDSMNSRFGLYGTPEDGNLCKYSAVSLSGSNSSLKPFTYAQFELKITNELEELASVGKLVFPVTDHDLYYSGNDVSMDGLHAIIKNRVGLHVIETIQSPITKHTGLNLASRDTEKTDYKFSMERGFD